MSVHERRQHFRIDDQIYFDYRIIKSGDVNSDMAVRNELLGENGQKFMDVLHYFQTIDYELASLGKSLHEPALARCVSLLNAKIDYLSRQMMIPAGITQHQVNISLGGIAFNTPKFIKEKTGVKIILYTKPKLMPVLVDTTVVYSKPHSETLFRTAVTFNELTYEQEQLLAQHILLAQVTCRAD